MNKTTRKLFTPSNNALLSCLIIGASAPISANADNIDNIINEFTAKASQYTDVNGIRIRDRSLAYHRKNKTGTDWKLKVHDYNLHGETGADTYEGDEIIGAITKEFNEYITTELSVGAVYLSNQRTGDETKFTNYKAKVTAKPNSKVSFSIEHGEDLLFKEAIIEDDTNKLVSGKTSKISGTWRAAKRVIIEGSSQYRELSDGNRSRHHRAVALYGISPDTPWIWAGVETQSLSYDDKKSNYWSPEDYEAHALVISSNFAINKKLSVNINGNINRTKEDNFDWASGSAITVGAKYNLTDKASIKAHATYSESTRENASWNGNNVGVSFTVSDF
ncbi:MAG: hypothetical protein DSZ29_00345 [Aquificaceae bacterium]|nr:MAG: hypothetical protein DSZ29_00345 [Aquificaceae bacterium]